MAAQPGHIYELYMAVWPDMREQDMEASHVMPSPPAQPVDGWQVIAIRFPFPRLWPMHEATASVHSVAREMYDSGIRDEVAD